MIDRQQLLALYSSLPSVSSLTNKLTEQAPQVIHVNGLVGSAPGMILNAVAASSEQSHILILNDHEEAAYFLNDIENNKQVAAGIIKCFQTNILIL